MRLSEYLYISDHLHSRQYQHKDQKHILNQRFIKPCPRKIEGTSLSLGPSIAKEIAERHGISLTVSLARRSGHNCDPGAARQRTDRPETDGREKVEA